MESEYERFGRTSYKVLLNKHGAAALFKKGWMFGLPDSGAGFIKKFAGWTLSPFISETAILVLKKIASSNGGEFRFNFLYSWLLYSCMARGYTKPE